MAKKIAAFFGEIISIAGKHENQMPGGFGFNHTQKIYSHVRIGQSEKKFPGLYWIEFSGVAICDEQKEPVEGWDYTGHSAYGALTVHNDRYEVKTGNSVYAVRCLNEAEIRALCGALATTFRHRRGK